MGKRSITDWASSVWALTFIVPSGFALENTETAMNRRTQLGRQVDDDERRHLFLEVLGTTEIDRLAESAHGINEVFVYAEYE